MADDIDPFAEPPVFEYSQVATLEDLIGIRNGYVLRLRDTQLAHIEKFTLNVAVETIDVIIDWIKAGKPTTYKGVYNEDTDTVE